MARASRGSGLFTTITFKVGVETEWGDVVTLTGNAPTLGIRPHHAVTSDCSLAFAEKQGPNVRGAVTERTRAPLPVKSLTQSLQATDNRFYRFLEAGERFQVGNKEGKLPKLDWDRSRARRDDDRIQIYHPTWWGGYLGKRAGQSKHQGGHRDDGYQ